MSLPVIPAEICDEAALGKLLSSLVSMSCTLNKAPVALLVMLLYACFLDIAPKELCCGSSQSRCFKWLFHDLCPQISLNAREMDLALSRPLLPVALTQQIYQKSKVASAQASLIDMLKGLGV